MDVIGANSVRGKVWGNTSCLFCLNNVEIHRIEANKYGYCSIHKHEYKYNMFYVESGSLRVVIYRPDADQIIEDITDLSAGQNTFVEPGLDHKFIALEDTVAYEIYWVELSRNDIVRKVVGGNNCKEEQND